MANETYADLGELRTSMSMRLSVGASRYSVVAVKDSGDVRYRAVSGDGLVVAESESFAHVVDVAAMDAVGVGDEGHVRDPLALFEKDVDPSSRDAVMGALARGGRFMFDLGGRKFVVTPSKEVGGVVVTTSRGDAPMLVGVYDADACDRIIGDALSGRALPLPE